MRWRDGCSRTTTPREWSLTDLTSTHLHNFAFQDTPTKEELTKEVEQWLEEDDTPKRVAPNRPNFYGAIEGVDVGTVWLTRMECCRDGIHRYCKH